MSFGRALQAHLLLCSLIGAVFAGPSFAAPRAWRDPAAHRQGFVSINGVRTQYLDWGGRGPALIFIPGLGDSPHIFDDLAPAFTQRFHVIAYAPRGHGGSAQTPPYDTQTLARDLCALLDKLGVRRASLIGHSMAGNLLTVMAVQHPDRVSSIVYLDAGYDWSDPDFRRALEGFPNAVLGGEVDSLGSIDAYRLHLKRTEFAGLDDMRRIEAYVRDQVVVQADGTVTPRVTGETSNALRAALWRNPKLDYRRVHVPALAVYAETTMDLRAFDPGRRQAVLAWERDLMAPFRAKSAQRLRNELPGVRIVDAPGAHSSFFLTSRPKVVCVMIRFLTGSAPGCAQARASPVSVEIATSKGKMTVALFPARAPGAVCNFLRYVRSGDFEGGRFFRTVRNDAVKAGGIDIIQAQVRDPARADSFGPIPLESTTATGLRHRAGTISMARGTPDSATSGFFIVIRGGANLDRGGTRSPDRQGFGAFGEVTDGLDIAVAIQHSNAAGEQLAPPIGIRRIRLLGAPPTACGAWTGAADRSPEAQGIRH